MSQTTLSLEKEVSLTSLGDERLEVGGEVVSNTTEELLDARVLRQNERGSMEQRGELP